jgi:hypothetical protein
VTAPEILRRDATTVSTLAARPSPKAHGRPAPEPGTDQKPAFDDDVIAGRNPLHRDARLKRGQDPRVVTIIAIGESFVVVSEMPLLPRLANAMTASLG